MTDEIIKKLDQRISDLETKLKEKPEKLEKSEKKIKVPREKSEYNIFVADHINKAKKKDPESKKKHTEYFSEAAKAWTAAKKK